MVGIMLDKINYDKVSKYANVLIFKEFYPKTKNVSYYLKWIRELCNWIGELSNSTIFPYRAYRALQMN